MNLHPEVQANLEQVTLALKDFDIPFVFVGGAVVGLLISDKAAPPARFTQDVDVIIPSIGLHRYHHMEEQLREAGFIPDPDVICRWNVTGVTVDIMPIDENILGFSNHWYKQLWDKAMTVLLGSGVTIHVVSSPYLIATKLEAFHSRGSSDYLLSHDIEDIVILLDGRPELTYEILDAGIEVKTFIQEQFKRFLNTSAFIDALGGHLPGDPISQQRVQVILKTMQQIASQ